MIREVKEQEKNVGEPQTSDWKSAWDLMEKMGSSWVSCESFKISAQPNWNDLIAWSNNQSSTRSCLATSNLGYGGVVLRQWKLSKHAPILDSKLRRFTAFLTMQKWLTSLLSRAPPNILSFRFINMETFSFLSSTGGILNEQLIPNDRH